MRAASRGLAGLALAAAAIAVTGCGSAPPSPPAGAVAGPVVTDRLGATCPAGGLDGDGYCPGSGTATATDPDGASCAVRAMPLGWCPGDAPSDPPAPVPTPRTVTLIASGSAAAVSYGPGGLPGALAHGTSPLTATVPSGGAGSWVISAALPAGGGSVSVVIVADGTVVATDSASGPYGIALAEIYRNDTQWTTEGNN